MKAPLFARSITDVEARASAPAMYSHETRCQKDDRIDESHDPVPSPTPTITSFETKFLREGQIGPVGASLIPALRGGSDGTESDGVPKHERAMPFVVPLVQERTLLCSVKLGNGLESFRVTCDESSLTEQSGVLAHPVRLSKSPGIGGGLLLGAAL